MGCSCGICKGRLGEIHYDEPSDSKHPLSFVIDEIKPISKYDQFGYGSQREAAEDWNNLQAAHYICNAKKSDKIGFTIENTRGMDSDITFKDRVNIIDGEW